MDVFDNYSKVSVSKCASEAPLVRKMGNTSRRETLVVTTPYESPSPVQTLEKGEGPLSMSPAILDVLN